MNEQMQFARKRFWHFAKVAILLTTTAISTGAWAQAWDGNTLHNNLSSEKGLQRLLALGYLMGVSDTIHSVVFCPPNEVTVGQIRDMVGNYLRDTPDKRHLGAEVLIGLVLRSKWPCVRSASD